MKRVCVCVCVCACAYVSKVFFTEMIDWYCAEITAMAWKRTNNGKEETDYLCVHFVGLLVSYTIPGPLEECLHALQVLDRAPVCAITPSAVGY